MKKCEKNKIELEIQDFINSIDKLTDEQIIKQVKPLIKDLRKNNCTHLKSKLLRLCYCTIKDQNLKIDFISNYCGIKFDDEIFLNWYKTATALEDFKPNEQEEIFAKILPSLNFEPNKTLLNMPESLKFGIELEYCCISYEDIKKLFKTKTIKQLMASLNLPKNVIESITDNTDFKKENEFHKWIFSTEGSEFSPEASSPIMSNNLDDLNQIKAMCTLFKTLDAKTSNGTGLHINIDANYFEGNIKALENLLIIWSECEELFFKIANEEKIRLCALEMALPIKENIQNIRQNHRKIKLNSKEDCNRFIYNIQVQNRLENLLDRHILSKYDLSQKLKSATTENEKYEIFKQYLKVIPKEEDIRIKFSSVNFNHMRWDKENKGRIEFRLFNSTLSYDCIIQNISLIGNLCKTSLTLAKDPTYKQEIFDKLLNHDISEEEKLDLLLDLLFDDVKEKQIFKNRWHLLKDIPFYEEFSTGKNTFTKSLKK